MYFSVSQRYIKQKQLDKAKDLLVDGCLSMIKHDQFGSALDLLDKLLGVFTAMKLTLDDSQTLNNILQLVTSFPVNENQFEQFTLKIIKWAQQDSYKIHHLLGSVHYKLGQYFDAEYHYMRGNEDSCRVLGKMEFEFSKVGEIKDLGYYILRAILGLLVMGKVPEAVIAFEEFVSLIPNELIDERFENVPITEQSPFLNFTGILLKVIQNNDLEQFVNATTIFQQYLSQDQYLVEVN